MNIVGDFEVRDITNKLACVCSFIKDSRKSISKIASALSGLWGNKKVLPPTDHFEVSFRQISIHQYNDNNDITREIMEGKGSWLESIEFNGQTVWDITVKPTDSWLEIEDKLFSDSSFRQDLHYLIQGDIQSAQM